MMMEMATICSVVLILAGIEAENEALLIKK